MKSTAITPIQEAERSLALAKDAVSAVKLVATGKTLATWARSAKIGEEQTLLAQRFTIRAQRNAGEQIAAGQERGEIATFGGKQVNQHRKPVTEGDGLTPSTQADLGISKRDSAEWQMLARAYPTDDELVADIFSLGDRPSLAAALGLREYHTLQSTVSVLQRVEKKYDADSADRVARAAEKAGATKASEYADIADTLFPPKVEPEQFPNAYKILDAIRDLKAAMADYFSDTNPLERKALAAEADAILAIGAQLKGTN